MAYGIYASQGNVIKKITEKARKKKIFLNLDKTNPFGTFVLEGKKGDTWKRGRMTNWRRA